MAEPFSDFSFDLVQFVQEFGPFLRSVETAASGDGIGAAMVRVLTAINSSARLTTKSAGDLGMDSGQLARIRSSLIEKGYLEKSRSPSNHRTIWQLTSAGERTAVDRNQRQLKAATEIFQDISDFQRERFLASVKMLTAHLSSRPFAIDVREAAPGETGVILDQAVNLLGSGLFGHDPARLAKFLHRYFLKRDDDLGFALVAAHQRHLAGTICVTIDRNLDTAKIDLFCLFQHYFYNLGFGRQLLDRAIERCRHLKIGKLTAQFPVYFEDERYLSRCTGWKVVAQEKQTLCGWTGIVEHWEKKL